MEKLKDIYVDEVEKPKVGYFWKGFALLLLGMVIGFLIAPVKKGLTVGCNCGNNYAGDDGDDFITEE